MTEVEIISMINTLTSQLRGITTPSDCIAETSPGQGLDPKKAIKEKSVTCLECGKTFKILTKKHLGTHGLTADEYRAKYGYKKGTPLVSKSLQRERRTKMKDMKLWEKRKKAV